METAAKVFLIIGMVVGGIFIVPLIIGIITYKKINNPTSKDDLIVWGILSIIFVNILGGIFTLLLADKY